MCAEGNKKANWFLSAAGNSRGATPSSCWADVCNVCSGGREGGPGHQDSLAGCTGATRGVTTPPSPWHGRGVRTPIAFPLQGSARTTLTHPVPSPPGLTLSVDIHLAFGFALHPHSLPHGTASLTLGNGLLETQNLKFLGQLPITVFCSCPLATGESM